MESRNWTSEEYSRYDNTLEELDSELSLEYEEPKSKRLKLDENFSNRETNFTHKRDIVSKSSSDVVYQWDETSSCSTSNSGFDEANVPEPKKSNSLAKRDPAQERLVLKLKRVSQDYFMVDSVKSSDPSLKFFNYESERYSFAVYVDDLPKTYKCKLCPKIYNKIASLQFHKRTHSKVPPGYNVSDFAKRFSAHVGPVEPYMPAAHDKIIERLSPHPHTYPGYFNQSSLLPHLRCGASLRLQDDSFFVGDLIGEGGFAKVYGVIWENGPPEERDSVMKVQTPANDWEWYILNQVTSNRISLQLFQIFFFRFT